MRGPSGQSPPEGGGGEEVTHTGCAKLQGDTETAHKLAGHDARQSYM